jgi:hypothetical protein
MARPRSWLWLRSLNKAKDWHNCMACQTSCATQAPGISHFLLFVRYCRNGFRGLWRQSRDWKTRLSPFWYNQISALDHETKLADLCECMKGWNVYIAYFRCSCLLSPGYILHTKLPKRLQRSKLYENLKNNLSHFFLWNLACENITTHYKMPLVKYARFEIVIYLSGILLFNLEFFSTSTRRVAPKLKGCVAKRVVQAFMRKFCILCKTCLSATCWMLDWKNL